MRELKENRDLFIKVPVSDYETGTFFCRCLARIAVYFLEKISLDMQEQTLY